MLLPKGRNESGSDGRFVFMFTGLSGSSCQRFTCKKKKKQLKKIAAEPQLWALSLRDGGSSSRDPPPPPPHLPTHTHSHTLLSSVFFWLFFWMSLCSGRLRTGSVPRPALTKHLSEGGRKGSSSPSSPLVSPRLPSLRGNVGAESGPGVLEGWETLGGVGGGRIVL